jgi:hypothetical protein
VTASGGKSPYSCRIHLKQEDGNRRDGAFACSAKSTNRLQGATRGFQLDAQEPIEVKLLAREPFFQILARGCIELHQHLSLLHVDEHTPGSYSRCSMQPLRQFLSALACEACERVLRDVPGHCVSDPKLVLAAYDTGCTEDTARAKNRWQAEIGPRLGIAEQGRLSSDLTDPITCPRQTPSLPNHLFTLDHAATSRSVVNLQHQIKNVILFPCK